MPTSANASAAAALCLGLSLPAALAQPARPAPPAATASAPARAASSPTAAAAAAAASAPAQESQRIEVTGSRESDTEQRRRSTAAKIIIGRDEIDKFGDATVGEVLRRLPGVTTPGAPGRGGPPRLRGLGNGFTQLLIDGQRVAPGFGVESLTPDQIERIEILRAPTAETGSRAIAGTINIVTREGFKRRLNEVRLGAGYENGKLSPGVSWTHNDSVGDFIYNLSGAVFKPHRQSSNDSRTTVMDSDDGNVLEDRSRHTVTTEQRTGLNLTTRLQWRLGDSGDTLGLNPTLFHTKSNAASDFGLQQAVRRTGTPAFYDTGSSSSDSSFTNARVGGQWRQRVGPVRLELGGSGGLWRSASDTVRNELNNGNATPTRVLQDRTRSREPSFNVTLKGSLLAGGSEAQPGHENSLVGGAEVEGLRRNESRTSLQDGKPLLTDFGDNLQASSLRLAAYGQNEWSTAPGWAAHAGLRWEGITTRGDSARAGNDPRPGNRSSVWTPLLHAVWKPDPKSRDQVRMSLTRSYRSPPLGSLIARPSVSRDYPVSGANIQAAPDTAGNPALKPELATGIDTALEHYLDGGGIFSANVFHRRISNLMRGLTALESVSYSPVPRWVRRQHNIGGATTQGLELEAKFRLDQFITAATPVELRGNLAFFRSRVNAVPGPDNRLDQQAKATANIGADYRLRSVPLTLGGNANWVPGYTTREEVDRSIAVSTRRVWDGYALWTFNPAVALRLLGSNLLARDHTSTTVSDSNTATGRERTALRSSGPSHPNWQLRLELKL